jgi:hypothetical protein
MHHHSGYKAGDMKRFFLTIFVVLNLGLFAQENSILENFFPVDGLNQWEKEFDISTLEEGTYNIIVEGVDAAGNIIQTQAVDIRIDPDSDLPISTITYPSETTKVSGNVSILGSARDDDSIGFIELRRGEGGYVRAEGRNFWSFNLSTESLEDGRYFITTRATDENGLAGPEYTTSFILDKNVPSILVESHTNGDLVSGKAKISGLTKDLNGLALFEYSIDDGETWIDVSLKGKTKEGEGTFAFEINSKDLEDGPQVVILRSTDLTQSVGESALLLYIDNTAPEIDIVYPFEEELENGRFTVVGHARDDVGLLSLKWAYKGGEFTEIPLSPGNPFWSIDVDFVGEKQMDLQFELVDIAQNITKLQVKRDLDLEADKPSVQLLHPLEEAITAKRRFQGWILDDDAPKALRYKIDNQDEVVLETGRSFDISLEDLEPGNHRITMRGEDVHGQLGDQQQVEFSILPREPIIRFTEISGETSREYKPGLEFSPEDFQILSGTISFESSKGSASYSLPGVEEQELQLRRTDSEDIFAFSIKLEEPIPYGQVPISITAVDDLGAEAVQTAFLWIRNLSKNQSSHGIYGLSSEALLESASDKLGIRYIGYPLDSIAFTGSPEGLQINESRGSISIQADRAGVWRNIEVLGVSERGTEFSYTIPGFSADFETPKIEITQPNGSINSDSIQIEGTVEDDLAVKSLEYQFGESEFNALALNGNEFTARVSGITDSSTLIRFRVEDTAGKQSAGYAVVHKAPAADDTVRAAIQGFVGQLNDGEIIESDLMDGKIFIAASLEGLESISNLNYSIDNGAAERLNGFPVATALIPMLPAGSHSITFTAEYGEGKLLTRNVKFTIAQPKAEIRLQGFTQGMDILRAKGIAGSFSQAIENASYSVNGAEPVSLKLERAEGGSNFTISFNNFKTGRHDLVLQAQDKQGRSIREEIFFFLIESAEGRSIDDQEKIYAIFNEPSAYKFYFNGRSVINVFLEGNPESYEVKRDGNILDIVQLGPEILRDAVLSIETEDGYTTGFNSLYLSSDSQAPVLTINEQLSNSYQQNVLNVSGKYQDNYAVTSFEVKINEGNYTPVQEIQPAEGEDAIDGFQAEIPLSGIDGPLVISFRVSDETGNSSEYEYLAVKDTKAVAIEQLLPLSNEDINGNITLHFKASDQWAETIEGSLEIGEASVPAIESAGFFTIQTNLTSYSELPEVFTLNLSDDAGNESLYAPIVSFNPESDKPVVAVQIPVPDTLFTEDPVFSGTVFDDDGISAIRYRVDEGEFIDLPGGSSFSITLSMDALGDNAHVLDIVAVDLEDVESDLVSLPFRISTKAPRAEMTAPEISMTNRGIVNLAGTSFDENGMESIYVSVDNGLSYNKAVGTEEWIYRLDSQILVDDTYMILIKAIDSYGVSSITSSLLNIDNTAPEIDLSLPRDGTILTDTMPIQMRINDDISVERVIYRIAPLDAAEEESQLLLEGAFEVSPVILSEVDIAQLNPGLYNLTIFGYDAAENEVVVSRNILKRELNQKSIPKILFPLDGASVTGPFHMEGRVEGDYIPPAVSILKNGIAFKVVETGPEGYFSLDILPEEMNEGNASFTASIQVPGAEDQTSTEISIDYAKEGPWVSFTSISTGDYVSQRPWIEGTLGYFTLNPEEELSRDERRNRTIDSLEYSLDNGRTFTDFSAKENWRFRLETQELTDGHLGLIVRATFKSGETALNQMYVFVDDTPPSISIITPEEGLKFNDSLKVNGTAFDANGLADIRIMLRPRSKNTYEVPQFIQGLYVDMHVLGATYWEVGLGLTFFDNNVKLQGLIGQAPEGRFNGMVYGIKLLANVASLPYDFLFGPDWEAFSSSLTVGAAFEYFTMEDSPVQENGLVLGSIILQIELLKVELKNLGMLNTYSAYVENQLWFISSDIQGGLEFRMAFGLRVNVF